MENLEVTNAEKVGESMSENY